ncbi:DivIVA domain-containing protein [Sphaerisporangium rufum]|nr:DivIVA domain-containing protein [Sphaerisporangium rufum]
MDHAHGPEAANLPSGPPPAFEFDVVLGGYDHHAVHHLIHRVEKTFAGTADDQERVTADFIRGVTFKRKVRGYDRHQVDDALEECARLLEG